MTDIPKKFEITDELYRTELNIDAHANILAILSDDLMKPVKFIL